MTAQGHVRHVALFFRLIDGLDAIEGSAEFALGDLYVIVVLQIEPQLRRGAERLAKAKRRIGGDASMFASNPLDPRAGQAAHLGERARRHLQRNEEFLCSTSPGCMGLSFLAMSNNPLMVFHDLDLGRAFLRPNKANAELAVDPDRMQAYREAVASCRNAHRRLHDLLWVIVIHSDIF